MWATVILTAFVPRGELTRTSGVVIRSNATQMPCGHHCFFLVSFLRISWADGLVEHALLRRSVNARSSAAALTCLERSISESGVLLPGCSSSVLSSPSVMFVQRLCTCMNTCTSGLAINIVRARGCIVVKMATGQNQKVNFCTAAFSLARSFSVSAPLLSGECPVLI